jgi:hypothetical protein
VSACNKVLRKLFLKPYTIGIIPKCGYSGGVKYSKKAKIWLLYKGKVEGIKILHARNCREYRLPELPCDSCGDTCHDIDAMLRKEDLIKCCILPPKRLYHPVLPFRCKNKLLFSLCRTCAMEMNTSIECTHQTAAERALIGSWVMDEVRLAV